MRPSPDTEGCLQVLLMAALLVLYPTIVLWVTHWICQ